MSSLTEEQQRRIEENRRKALEKLAARQATLTKVPVTSYNHSNPIPAKNATSPVTFYSNNNNDINKFKFHSKPNHSSATNNISQFGNIKTDLQSSFTKSERTSNSFPSVSTFMGNNSSKTTGGQNSSSNDFAKLKSESTAKDMSVSKQTNDCMSYNKDTKQLKGTFVLLSRKRFFVDVGYHKQMIEIFKTMPSRVYDAKTKKWNFLLEDHDKLVSALKSLQPNVVLSPLPTSIVNLFSHASDVREIKEYDLSQLDPVLLNALMPFQKTGVHFGIQCGGKVLIADDMGLGKTIQAIGIANYFKKDWPLLVVTPSSVRYSWAESFYTWLPSEAHEVLVINSGKDYISNNKILLVSYDVLTKRKDDIIRKGFKSVIMDESHFLKNPKSARTKAAQIIMQHMKRIIMLSGTPALSRPIELFPQISALKPKEFSNFLAFGVRYCNGSKKPWGWDFSGSSNMEELQLLLEETVMIRRLKSEVITQLPSKRRQMIVLDPSMLKSNDKVLQAMSKKMGMVSLKGSERRGVLLEYFHQTGVIKLPAICQYLKDLLEADKKFICFGHHQVVLSGICDVIENLKIDYIRIDGSTSSEQRKILCDKFQLKDSCKIAVLSITAANAGITLTAASLVVFAELFWNPGILTQAEDRAHRIGQEDSVIIQYLVAKGTADDEIWPLVQRKLNILNKAGLSKDNFSEADTVVAEKSCQPNLMDFWSELDVEIDLEMMSETEDTPNKRLKLS